MKKVIFLSALMLSLVFYFSNCNLSTANISDIKMCETIDDYQCQEENTLFNVNSPQIYCSCKLNNAPDGTNLKFAWYYLGDEKVLIDTVTTMVPGGSSTYDMHSYLTIPDNGWPVGDYEVVLKIDTDNSEPLTKSFKVE